MKSRKLSLHRWLLPSVILVSATAHGADGTWNVDANGLWSLGTNWLSNAIADGSGFTASFTNDITADRTVSINSDRTLTNVIFGDSNPATAGSWILNNNSVSTNNLILAGTTPTITVNALGTGKSATISAIIEGTAGLTKEGSGNLILSGVNTYSGGTFINNGNITAATGVGATSGNATAFGTGDITVNSGGTITGGAARSIGGGSATTRAVNLNGSTLDVTYAGTGGEYFSKLNLTGGSITASGAEYFRAASSGLTISSLESVSSSTISSVIDLTFGNLVVNVADGAATNDLVINGRITQITGAGSGNKSLTKNGSGTLVLTSSTTGSGSLYADGTIISNGTIIGKTNDFAFGNTTSTITLGDVNTGSSNVALLLGDARSILYNMVVSSNGSGTATIGTDNFNPGAANTNFGGTLTLNRNVILQAGSTDRTTFSNEITGTGNITITSPFANDRRIVFDRTSGTANSFVGDITIANNARLQIGSGSSIANRTITDTSAIRFENANSTFRLAPTGSGDSETIGSLVSINSGAGVVDMISGTSFTLAIGGDNNANASFSGVITDSAGNLGITKIGTGSQILSGANTYTGATAVNTGTLRINGNQTSATGAVTVASGATLGGSGTIGGATTLTTGTLAPGSAAATVGTTTFGAGLALNSTSIFNWDMQQAATSDPGVPGAGGTNAGSYDKVALSGGAGSLTSTGGDAVFKVVLGSGKAFTDAFWDTNKEWTDIFTGTGMSGVSLASIFSTFNANGSDLTGGVVAGQGSFGFTSNTLTWSAVPEPTSALAGLLLTAGLLRRRRAR